MKRPIKKLTIEQLAARIWMLPKDTEYNFSQEEDGSDYWGVKRLDIFNGDIILIGYYGDHPDFMFDRNQDDSYTIITDALKAFFQREFLWVFEN